MTEPPFETIALRTLLAEFLNKKVVDPISREYVAIGNYKYGVYAFFDYDDEPIYVGQTNEMLRTRIRRHLTNQRTDAVAMKVLDPYEVYKVCIWPLAQYQDPSASVQEAKAHLNWLEYDVFQYLLQKSHFGAVLNEKNPPKFPQGNFERPASIEGCIVSEEVFKLRSHKDTRIARRAETLSLLAKVISERQVQPGLRNTLVTQAKRLAWLSEQRLKEFEGIEDQKDE